MSISLENSRLGTHLECWADLLEGEGASDAALAEQFVAQLLQRQIPNIQHGPEKIYVGLENRDFHLSQHGSGGTLSVAIRKYGNDLYVGWDLWFKPQIKLGVIMFNLFAAFFAYVIPMAIAGKHAGDTIYLAAIVPALLTFFGLIVLEIFGGLLFVGRWDGWLRTTLDLFAYEDSWALKFAVDQSIRSAADKVGLKKKLRQWNPDVGSGNRIV